MEEEEEEEVHKLCITGQDKNGVFPCLRFCLESRFGGRITRGTTSNLAHFIYIQ